MAHRQGSLTTHPAPHAPHGAGNEPAHRTAPFTPQPTPPLPVPPPPAPPLPTYAVALQAGNRAAVRTADKIARHVAKLQAGGFDLNEQALIRAEIDAALAYLRLLGSNTSHPVPPEDLVK